MKKIGLIFDSTCGMSKKEVESKGFGYISMLIIINGKVYSAGDDIDSKGVMNQMVDRNIDIKTSLPPGDNIIAAFDKVLENYDQAIYLGISSKFSGTHNVVKLMAEDKKYKGKIFVPETEFSSPWISYYSKQFIEMLNEFKSIDEIVDIINKTSPYMTGYLSPGDIWWFYKGGRISKVQYVLGNLAKVYPILKVTKGAFDKSMTIKVRNRKKTMVKMIELMESKIKYLNDNKIPFKYLALSSGDKEIENELTGLIKERFKAKNKDIIVTDLTAEQTAHLGPNSFGFTIFAGLKGIK